MPKTVTLRLNDEVYRRLSSAAIAENRSISNLIETLALKKLNEEMFTDEYETEEILSNAKLLKKLERGHKQVRLRKGALIG